VSGQHCQVLQFNIRISFLIARQFLNSFAWNSLRALFANFYSSDIYNRLCTALLSWRRASISFQYRTRIMPGGMPLRKRLILTCMSSFCTVVMTAHPLTVPNIPQLHLTTVCLYIRPLLVRPRGLPRSWNLWAYRWHSGNMPLWPLFRVYGAALRRAYWCYLCTSSPDRHCCSDFSLRDCGTFRRHFICPCMCLPFFLVLGAQILSVPLSHTLGRNLTGQHPPDCGIAHCGLTV